MIPSKRHEQFGYMIGRLIDVWTEKWASTCKSCRTVTFKRGTSAAGLEPDNCYLYRP